MAFLSASPLLLTASPAWAAACGLYPNTYAQQAARKGYYGQFGYFYTYNPSIPNPSSAFTLTHLYSFAPGTGGSTFTEIGWYKGYGPDLIASTKPHYYTASADAQTPYNEVDLADYPDVNTDRLYEINYTGYNYTTARYKWAVYAANLTTARRVWEIKGMASGVPTAGGEISYNAGSGTQMRSRGKPRFQLKNSGGTWSNWTPTYMSSKADTTTACADAGYTWTYYAHYEDFYAGGQKP